MAPETECPARPCQRARVSPWRWILPSTALLLMAAAFTITKTGRDALYVQKNGVNSLPLAYLCLSLLAPAVAMVTLLAMTRWGARPVRVLAPLSMGLLQVTVPLWAQPGPGRLMMILFVFVPAAFGVLLSATWLLAAELAPENRQQRTRSFAVFGAASMAGSIAGAWMARWLAASIAPQTYFMLGAVLLASASVVIVRAHSLFPRASIQSVSTKLVTPSLATLRLVLSDIYVRILILTVTAASITGVLIEYLFYVNAGAAAAGGSRTTVYFANFYLWLNGAGLALQLAAIPLLQRRLGLGKSLLFVPAAILGASVLLSLRYLHAGTLRMVEGGLKSSFYRSGWEQSYALVAEEARGAIKILVDGVASRFGEGVAALGLILFVTIQGQSGSVINPLGLHAVLLVAAASWGASVYTMRKLIDHHESCLGESEQDPEGHPVEGCVLTATIGRQLL